MTDDTRFWARVEKLESGCWEWQGARTAGYGSYHRPGIPGSVYTHRYAWEMLRGPIPAGLQIDHLCRNRACCNPDHLEPVTQQENLRRGLSGAHVRARKSCPQGHEYDEANTRWLTNGNRACRACIRARARAAWPSIRDVKNAKLRARRAAS